MEIKVPFYNIVNMLLTGLVFLGGLIMIFPQYAIQIIKSEFYENLKTGPEIIFTICLLAIAYEMGLIINRAGSVIVEPVLKKLKLIPFNNNYTLFNEKKKAYPIMSTLSREFALSRTSIALFLVLAVISGLNNCCKEFAVCIVVAFIFYLSCRKHSAKIVELMESPNSKDMEFIAKDKSK